MHSVPLDGGGQAVGEIEKVMQELGWEIPVEGINIKYIPNDDELITGKETGKRLGEYVLNKGK